MFPSTVYSYSSIYSGGSFGSPPNNGPYYYYLDSSASPPYAYLPQQHTDILYGNQVSVQRLNMNKTSGYGTGSALTRLDEANEPAASTSSIPERSLRSCWDGRYIYMVYYYIGANYELRFASFDCQSETWVYKDVVISSQSNDIPKLVPGVYGSIDIDSNGKLYVNYDLYVSMGYHRVRWAYSINSGSTWTAGQTIPSSPGSKEGEWAYNLFCVGTNVYHFYVYGGTPYYQRCLCYNGSSWSSENTFQASSFNAYYFTGRPAIWTTSGSELMTIVCTASGVRTAYSYDSVSGSSPNWTNKLTVATDFMDTTWYHVRDMVLYNGYPVFTYFMYWTWTSCVNTFNGRWYFMGRARNSYSSWYPASSGSGYPLVTWGSAYPDEVNHIGNENFRSSQSLVPMAGGFLVSMASSGSASYTNMAWRQHQEKLCCDALPPATSGNNASWIW